MSGRNYLADPLSGPAFKALTYGELAKVGSAVADPRRLELLDLLCQSEKNVERLSGELKMSVASTSHHLQILKASRLVVARKQGRFVFYRATHAGMRVWKNLVDIGNESIAEIKCAVLSFFDAEEEFRVVGMSELQEMVERNEILLVDVRPTDEYEAGHFPGAVSLPLKELEARVASLQRGKEVVAYCRGPFCLLSKEAVGILKRHGIAAYRLTAGVVDWRLSGAPEAETGHGRNNEVAG